MDTGSPPSATRPPLALIAGPTASGKSGLAVRLAKCLERAGRAAVIVNADASQVYADIPILSAQPTAAERQGIPHLLFGHIDGAEVSNAARWASDARAAIAAAHDAGAVPILVGGTGLYIATLLGGIAPVPEIDADVRGAVRALSVGDAYRALQTADPLAADQLNPLDSARIARALEVVRSTGTPLHIWQRQRVGGIGGDVGLCPLILLPPRDALVLRCDARLAAMFAGGAVAEVQALIERRLDPALPVMGAIGVPQLAAWLSAPHAPGGRAAALAAAMVATRRYAKRQYTWFRGQSPPDWPQATQELNISENDDLVIKLRNMLLTQ